MACLWYQKAESSHDVSKLVVCCPLVYKLRHQDLLHKFECVGRNKLCVVFAQNVERVGTDRQRQLDVSEPFQNKLQQPRD